MQNCHEIYENFHLTLLKIIIKFRDDKAEDSQQALALLKNIFQ